MSRRRSLIGAGLLASLGAAAGASAAPTPDQERGSDEDVVRAIENVRAEVSRLRTELAPGTAPAIGRIREQQRQYLKAQHSFPEFIDVGIGVWEEIYDWHVRFQQPLNISRRADGRYVLSFMQTLLVLRPEHVESYISAPYERER
jgi:hypothetical protein